MSLRRRRFPATPREPGEAMIGFAASVFVSAFLLFQIQPVIARYILPWFGGSPAVWTTCMSFFQVGLLAGYAYAHVLATRVAPRWQPVVHLALLFASLAAMPVTPSLDWIPSGSENPSLRILTLLSATVGVPFALLSASAPLLQRWFATVCPGKSPFRLYALSNFGSLLALLSYPFIVEPRLPLAAQTSYWSYGYGVFVALLIACGVLQWRAAAQVAPTPVIAPPATALRRWIWIALSACGSVMLLATTNQICQDVAVIPFLWVPPLSLYLVSFIVCFENDRWYHRGIWLPFLAVSVAAVVYLLNQAYAETEMSLVWQIVIYCSMLFACCMVCHGELVRRRPPVGELTSFYLWVALGGALGGVFVNWVAPVVFDGFWELPGGLLLVVALAGYCTWSDRPVFAGETSRRAFGVAWSIGAGLMTFYLGVHVTSERDSSIFNQRGFYGVQHVYDEVAETRVHRRSFYNGRIHHGSQLLGPGLGGSPTSYYGLDSGIAAAIWQHPKRRLFSDVPEALRIGVIGLGIGSVSVHALPQDTLRFYELNPQVEAIAREYFTFLADQHAEIEVVIGDARLSLERELRENGAAGFDVLVLDAFSGDSIPVHLLTAEAFALYWQHLRPDGVLAANITNFHLDLSDLVRQMAARFGKTAILIRDPAKRDHEFMSDWVLITSNRRLLDAPRVNELQTVFPRPVARPIVWTDDFSNLFDVVDW